MERVVVRIAAPHPAVAEEHLDQDKFMEAKGKAGSVLRQEKEKNRAKRSNKSRR